MVCQKLLIQFPADKNEKIKNGLATFDNFLVRLGGFNAIIFLFGYVGVSASEALALSCDCVVDADGFGLVAAVLWFEVRSVWAREHATRAFNHR